MSISVPQAPDPALSGILTVHGTDIVDVHGKKVVLKGAGLGGHLNMENCETRVTDKDWAERNHLLFTVTYSCTL